MEERTHTLKTWPEPFAALQDGRKRFEYRRDDRGYAVGDKLVLALWDPHKRAYMTGKPDVFRESSSLSDFPSITFEARVTYIVHGRFGVPEGYCVMGIEPWEPIDNKEASSDDR